MPNSMSFRLVTTLTVRSKSEVPDGFTGRVVTTIDGVVQTVSWLTRGELEDPAPRTPAYQVLRGNGKVKQVRHYRAGRLHDPAPGVAAVQGFYPDGSRKYEEHFRYGNRHDHAERPAIRKWRSDGALRSERHYYEGLRIELVDAVATA